MNAIACASGLRSIIVAVLLSAAAPGKSAAQAVADPLLTLTINKTNQTAVVSWFGDAGVLYQLESSSNLTAWTDSGPAHTGSGNYLNVTQSIAGRPRSYFRFKHPPDIITAVFTPATGTLRITGGDQANIITVGRNAAGAILVNGGAVPVTGGVPTVANTAVIEMFGRGGNDVLSLDEANGALPQANLAGEVGEDTLSGGSGGDELIGGPGRDVLFGRGGADSLFGGADDDSLTGGDGDDQAFGEAGNDRMIWNPGDDTDLNEGGSESDTVEVNGGGGAEVFTTTANGTRVRFDRVTPAPFSIDIGTTEKLVLNAGGGDDNFSATGNLASLIQVTVDGGPGLDTLMGGNGIDLLIGGDGDDLIDGNPGNDTIFMGAGNDTFRWDPGDGSDTVEGQAGNNRMVFNGSAGNEIFDVIANGNRVRFTRNLGSIVMDLDDIEALELNALGGTDSIVVADLTGTDLTGITANLAGTIGGTAGDGAVDNVIVNSTGGTDTVTVTGTGTGTTAAVTGLSATVTVNTAEGANDRITVNGQGGNDTLQANTLPSGVISLTLSGGTGDDSLTGSGGADQLTGDDDTDFIDGQQGADVVLLGAGNDTFQWDPGDGNDVVEGQAGTDTLLFNGSNAAEIIDLTANGARLLFSRNVANVILDCDDVEKIEVNAFGAVDTLTVGTLTGTDVSAVIADLTISGAGDGQADNVIVNGTNGDDVIAVSSAPGTVAVTGLSAAVTLNGGEPADRLTINALSGLDNVIAAALAAGTVQLSIAGGLGNDVLLGGHGGDSLNGGDGNDTMFGGGGDDAFTWNPGDDNDIVEGQAGSDRLIFNGAIIAEIFTVSANGSRVRFTRDIANVVMDFDDVENLDLNLLGGADRLTINNLAGTDLTLVNASLAGTAGGTAGDAQADLITVNGTANPDTFNISATSGVVEVSGLTTLVRITQPEAANDNLTLNGLGGMDFFATSPGVSALIGVTTNQ